jgi:hypothetical protein
MTDNGDPIYDDEPVVISATGFAMRISADGLRALKKGSGHTMTELLSDEDDEVARLQVLAFAELYRRLAPLGHLPDAAELWARAGQVELDLEAPAPDPTPSGPSTGSPPSADIGA